jgi:hypothetical protein
VKSAGKGTKKKGKKKDKRTHSRKPSDASITKGSLPENKPKPIATRGLVIPPELLVASGKIRSSVSSNISGTDRSEFDGEGKKEASVTGIKGLDAWMRKRGKKLKVKGPTGPTEEELLKQRMEALEKYVRMYYVLFTLHSSTTSPLHLLLSNTIL